MVIIWCWPKGSRSPQARLFLGIEWFTIECRKTKTKVITLANHKGRRAICCPIKNQSISQSERKLAPASHDWFWFYLRLVLLVLRFGWEIGASFLSQSLSVEMQNQSKRKLLSTLKWKWFYCWHKLCYNKSTRRLSDLPASLASQDFLNLMEIIPARQFESRILLPVGKPIAPDKTVETFQCNFQFRAMQPSCPKGTNSPLPHPWCDVVLP